MKIAVMKANHVSEPLGYWLERPTLSWTVEESISARQASARVRIFADEALTDCRFDSGEADLDNRGFTPDFSPAPRTRYWWQVTVTGDKGDRASGLSWFETGKGEEPWQAGWITPDAEPERHPLVRGDFPVAGKVRSARVYATGMGCYYLYLNGKPVSDELLAPGFHDYDSWVQAQTYDVTGLLREGENTIGAMLGKGWAKGRYGADNFGISMYCKDYALLCELHVNYADGREQVFCTDESWVWQNGPIVDSAIYDGEIVNAAFALPRWAEPGCDLADWRPMVPWTSHLGPVRDRLSTPVKIHREFRPQAILRSPAGETIIDLGQNISGWLRLRLDLPAGREVTLWHGEKLEDGNFYRGNLGSAKAEFHFTSDGTPQTVEPRFTWFGFRYAKVEGWEPALEDITACAISSQLEETGGIKTSDPLLNRLIANARWSQLDNFIDVPTDCPQRAEREGWTGDAQVFSGTALFNADAAPFYLKYSYDVWMEQRKHGGCVPSVVPDVNTSHQGQPEPLRVPKGECAWADVATILPWNLYLYTGDKTILARRLDSMRAWVDYVERTGVDVRHAGGWLGMFHFGDWLALDGRSETSVKGGTEDAFLAAAYFVWSAELTAKAAGVLGEAELADRYHALADRTRADIAQEYFTPNGRGALQTQTFYVITLYMHLCPEEQRSRFMDALVALLKADGVKLKTGFIGTPLLCRVLSAEGRGDLAWRLLMRKDLPGWLYPVTMGATTIWERWNSVLPDGHINPVGMNSLNHYSYGSIVEWMYRHMCGLEPVESEPGFKRVTLRPEPNRRLRRAAMHYRSAMGLYRSEWEITDDGRLRFSFTIPFGGEAEVTLPDADASALEGAEGLGFVQRGSAVTATLPTGTYRISYRPTRGYLAGKYSLASNVGELMDDPAARAVLEQNSMLGQPRFFREHFGDRTLRQVREDSFFGDSFCDDWEELEDKLLEL